MVAFRLYKKRAMKIKAWAAMPNRMKTIAKMLKPYDALLSMSGTFLVLNTTCMADRIHDRYTTSSRSQAKFTAKKWSYCALSARYSPRQYPKR